MNVKLQAMLNAGRHVAALYGRHSLERALAECRPDTRARFESGIAIEWLPMEQLTEFYEAVVRVAANGNRDILRSCGAASAKRNLGVRTRIAAWVFNPEFVLRRVASLWSQYNDAGEVKLLEMSPGLCRMEIRGVPHPHWGFCTSLLGWGEEVARAVGWQPISVRHVDCRAEGGERCIFEIRYRV